MVSHNAVQSKCWVKKTHNNPTYLETHKIVTEICRIRKYRLYSIRVSK